LALAKCPVYIDELSLAVAAPLLYHYYTHARDKLSAANCGAI